MMSLATSKTQTCQEKSKKMRLSYSFFVHVSLIPPAIALSLSLVSNYLDV